MRTLDPAMSSMELLEEWLYTFARLDAFEATKPLAAELAPLEAQWNQVLQREIALVRQRILARAQVAAADGELDQFLDVFNNTLLTTVANDRTTELYRRFFSTRRPSELKRPVLGEQLATMAGWLGTLEKLDLPQLQALGQTLSALVKKGQEAEAALQRAVQELDDFGTLNEYRQLVDQLNAVRSRVYGRLKELRHTRPELNLPADFAEQFFLREERSRGATLASQQKTVARLEQQLERHREILRRLQGEAEAEAAAQRAATRAELENELARVEKQRQLAAQREAELRSKLGR